ncbi:hypothetical protein M514_02982 [Trichuris suis]|uniref:Uncharacterized protein n=1 Tax=Trichuris suis TaxID=68888 RepID=A0A085MG58_9BILA|nr:hypothetical protein M513_02982 [Trichuris suis]KFD69139.1 hypothetical protein M514_02982 [Trichuris suis]
MLTLSPHTTRADDCSGRTRRYRVNGRRARTDAQPSQPTSRRRSSADERYRQTKAPAKKINTNQAGRISEKTKRAREERVHARQAD